MKSERDDETLDESEKKRVCLPGDISTSAAGQSLHNPPLISIVSIHWYHQILFWEC